MPLVSAKCTNCGANLEVDNTKDAAICPYCGTPYIVEKAINYVINNTNVSNVITNSTVFISNGIQTDANYHFKTCINYLKMGQEKKAQDSIVEARKIEPDNGKYYFYHMIIQNCGLEEYFNKYSKYQSWEVEFLKEGFNIACRYLSAAMGLGYAKIFDKERCKLYCNVTNDGITHVDIFDIFLRGGRYCGYSDWRELENIVFLLSLDKDKKLNPYERKKWFTYEGSDPICSIYELACGKKIDAKEFKKSNYKSKEIKNLIIERYPNKLEINNNLPGGCYIATCVYGSYDCPEVWTLRRFRDYTLYETWYGRLFIRCYYAISPTLVRWFGNQKWFRKFWKSRLDAMVEKLNRRGVEDSQYSDKY